MKRLICMRWACAAAGAWLLAGAGRASAATISFGPDTEGPYKALTDNPGSGSFTLPQFDTLGGARVLTGVTVEVIIDSFGGKAEFDNQSATGGPITLSIGSSVRVKGPASPSQVVVIPLAITTASSTITGTTGDFPADFAGTDYFFVNGLDLSDTKSASRTSAGDLAPYIGAGNVTFAWDLAGLSTAGQDTSAFDSGSFRASETTFYFHTTVHYDFVPEPASLGLLIPGILLLLRRRVRGPRWD